MKILDYDHVDPLSVLHTTMLALDFPLTPEHVAHIRRTDPRPFPCFTVNAVEDGTVLGQVGVFRLPMVSTEGREDVGGVWAVSTHSGYSGRGVASALLEEAHARMREAGLRFSTLGTDRYRVAYKLYQRHGYVDMNVWGSALADWETAHQPTRLRAQSPGREGYELVETLFETIAPAFLGFAWRHKPFTRLQDKVNLDDIWVLWMNDVPVGYVFTCRTNSLLKIDIQLLRMDIDAAEAVSAVVSRMKACYVQVRVSHPSDIARLKRAGYQVAHPTWGAFMIKSLTPEVTVEDARLLFRIGTDRFLVSGLDVT